MTNLKLNPGRIYKKYMKKSINEETAIDMIEEGLKSEEVRDELLRVALIRLFDLLKDPNDPKYFEFLKDYCISDEDLQVRKESIRLITKCVNAFDVLKFWLNNEEIIRDFFLTIYKSILNYLKNLISLERNKNGKDLRNSLIEILHFDNLENEEDLIDRITSYFTIKLFQKENFTKYLRSHQIYEDIDRDFKDLRKLRPDSFGYTQQENHITGIGFYHCHLTHIPEIITLLSKLKVLYLEQNNIIEVPNKIGRYSQITELYINNNDIDQNYDEEPKEIKLPDFNNFQNLEILELHSAGIGKEIPNSIGFLKELKRLVLSKNPQLESIPDDICYLYNLEYLNLNSCNIKRLPSNIGNLYNLKKLDLANNNLSSVPKLLNQLINLRELYVSSNDLNGYISEFWELEKKGVKIYKEPQK
jgi:hypothetical protein